VELQHDFVVPIDVSKAWVTFNDLARIAPCFPGAVLTSVDGDDFTGTAKVKLGPVSLQYSGTGRFVERDESAYRAVIEASGKDKRGNGTAAATITARLEAQGSSTRVVVGTDLRITGRPAQFGRGMISDVGGKILDQFATCLATRLAEPPPEDPAGGRVEDTEPQEQSPVENPATAPSPPRDEVPRMTAEPVVDEPAQPSVGEPAQPAFDGSAQPAELDLGAVMLPALARRYGPTVGACLVTAAITWRLARCGR
jgi:carbon monoxide dehydrogenase subunit G